MKILTVLLLMLVGVAVFAGEPDGPNQFKYQTEQFADLRILRYQVPGFENLSLKEKELAYYLYQASLSGRDMIYDQNYKHNLTVRRTLEAILKNFDGDRKSESFRASRNESKSPNCPRLRTASVRTSTKRFATCSCSETVRARPSDSLGSSCLEASRSISVILRESSQSGRDGAAPVTMGSISTSAANWPGSTNAESGEP